MSKIQSTATGPALDAVRLSQEVLRHLPSGLAFFDAAGNIDEANPAAQLALGFSRSHGLNGLSLEDVFQAAELREPDGTVLGPAAAILRALFTSAHTLQRKLMIYATPDGERRRLGVTAFPVLRGDHPEPVGLICLVTDLTSIHALEEELQRRKNMSALGEMAAGIAHEFKNALATISGYAQMLTAHLEGASRGQAVKIIEQAAMLNNIATEFLTFARPLEVQPERVDLGRLLHYCADAIRVQDFPQVELRIAGEFPAVAGDSVLLTAAITNLLRNACEAIVHSDAQSQHGGHVQVSFAGLERQRARILFTDDGPGVPAELSEKIFIPFFTTKPSGTGLGLAMVHKIITAHQGSILLTDAAPGHTVFTVLLPVVLP
ncbi:MAG TPA: ATP-binding protein [Terriglobales bacterium]|nr:ATP-binding protein [Terriglobales bacterium]